MATYLENLLQEIAHRKRWLKKPIKDKRYIRGMLHNIIKDKIHSRKSGTQTTDAAIRAACLRKTGGLCYLCYRRYTQDEELAKRLPHLYFSKLQIDHIVPFSRFGPNTMSNYMPACSRCNNKKTDLSLGEFKAGLRKNRYGKVYETKNKSRWR